MIAYVVRRLLLIVPTLVGIMVINFFIVQAAPGGPVEQPLAQIRCTAVSATARVGGAAGGDTVTRGPAEPGLAGGDASSKYRGARGMDPQLIRQLEKQYGFDQPPLTRFL